MIRGVNAALLKGEIPVKPAELYERQPWLCRDKKTMSERIEERDRRISDLEQRIALAHGPEYLSRLYSEKGVGANRYNKLRVLYFEEGKVVGNALAAAAAQTPAPAAEPQPTITAVSPPAATVQSVLASLRALPLKPANLKARQAVVKDNLDLLLLANLSREQALLIFGAIADNHDRAEFYLANKKNLV